MYLRLAAVLVLSFLVASFVLVLVVGELKQRQKSRYKLARRSMPKT